ncbi:MAG TPA: hypothetical protein VE986_08590 [Hyphomicrobiales bacterium]|nr:hypothetical protein [Hyphomicrobiales bacterium]
MNTLLTIIRIIKDSPGEAPVKKALRILELMHSVNTAPECHAHVADALQRAEYAEAEAASLRSELADAYDKLIYGKLVFVGLTQDYLRLARRILFVSKEDNRRIKHVADTEIAIVQIISEDRAIYRRRFGREPPSLEKCLIGGECNDLAFWRS